MVVYHSCKEIGKYRSIILPVEESDADRHQEDNQTNRGDP